MSKREVVFAFALRIFIIFPATFPAQGLVFGFEFVDFLTTVSWFMVTVLVSGGVVKAAVLFASVLPEMRRMSSILFSHLWESTPP